MSIIVSYFIFFIAILTSLSLLPQVNKLSLALNFADEPGQRKQHFKPIVRTGGIGIFFGFLLSSSLYFLISYFLNQQVENLFILNAMFFGGLSFFLIGLFDDLFSLSPFLRLFLQVIVASIIWLGGLRTEALDIEVLNKLIFWGEYLPNTIFISNSLSLILTIIWIVGIINSINWIDGLDGLAAGTSIISLLTLLICNSSGLNLVNIFIITLIGSCIGFLKFNFYPAKIMMGDGGSYFIGFSLSFLSLIIFSQEIDIPENSIKQSFNLVVPIFIMLVPLLDMSKVIISRLLRGKSPFYPDRLHIHHRILNLSFSHPQTVNIIFLLSSISSIFGLYLFKDINLKLILVPFFILLIYLLFISKKNIHKT